MVRVMSRQGIELPSEISIPLIGACEIHRRVVHRRITQFLVAIGYRVIIIFIVGFAAKAKHVVARQSHVMVRKIIGKYLRWVDMTRHAES